MAVMAEPSTLRRDFRRVITRWAILVSVWGSLAVLAILQIYLARAAAGHPPPWWPLLRLEGPIWLFWLAATVAVIRLGSRFPLDRNRLASSLGLHALAALSVGTMFVAFRMLWYQAFNPYPFLTPGVTAWFWQYFRDSFIDGFVLYWAILGVHHAVANYARYRERDLDAAQMQAQLAESRLQTLRSQLRPHFLFNTLHTVSAVLESDPGTARNILGRLGELLRASLAADNAHEITLAAELALLQAFVDIESTRFGDHLQVDVEVPQELRSALVPSFLLQPLIENAVRYGVASRSSPGRVSIRTIRCGGALEVSVSDDGPGIAHSRIVEGVGLGNTRARLAALYGAQQSLTLRNLPQGGLEVLVRLPYHIVPQLEPDRLRAAG